MPLAFFCTLFFRHRKKSVSAPWDGKSQSAPESARHSPPWGIAYGNVVTYDASRVAFRSPPCTPFGSPTEAIERPIGLQALFPRRSRRVIPRRGRGLRLRAHWGLSSGQTIGAARPRHGAFPQHQNRRSAPMCEPPVFRTPNARPWAWHKIQLPLTRGSRGSKRCQDLPGADPPAFCADWSEPEQRS